MGIEQRKLLTAMRLVLSVVDVEHDALGTLAKLMQNSAILATTLHVNAIQPGRFMPPAARSDGGLTAIALQNQLPKPDGMVVVELPDGCRVFSPLDANPEAVPLHVAA